MPYAILRFEKRKGGPASALEKHHERKKDRYASNPDIDMERKDLNYHLVEPRLKYYGEIQTRIEKAQRENPKCKVRKDSVKFIDAIVTASPEFFERHSSADARRYFAHALDFIKREAGEENIFSAVVHMDEHNPHMHLCFVPLTKDKRLSAKEVIGDRNKLVEWQDKFHDHMAAQFHELQRGESAAVTKRKHIPTWLFKQANRLTKEMTAIRDEIENIGTFNSGKQKEKILDLLCKWYPQINAFENKLKPYDQCIKDLERDLRVIESEFQRKDSRAYRAEQQAAILSSQLQEYQEFIDSIPEELFEQLKQRYEDIQLEQDSLELTR